MIEVLLGVVLGYAVLLHFAVLWLRNRVARLEYEVGRLWEDLGKIYIPEPPVKSSKRTMWGD